VCHNLRFVSQFILAPLSAVRVFFRSRYDTALEILALRQQVAVLKRKRPRPRLNPWDRLFWTTLRVSLASDLLVRPSPPEWEGSRGRKPARSGIVPSATLDECVPNFTISSVSLSSRVPQRRPLHRWM
jgi:hypothetical protein